LLVKGEDSEQSLLEIDATTGHFYARDLTVESKYFNASPGKFIFGDNESVYFNFSLDDSTSYI
jgi:hypothetical protein